MEPRAYLRLLVSEWKLLVELFEASKIGLIDYASLLQIVEIHKSQNNDTYALIEKLINFGILDQPLSGETLYQLGGLTEYTVSNLLQEQRLGLSESIQAYIRKLDELSKNLLNATSNHDEFGIIDSCKKINHHIQDIKHQVRNNLHAIQNIVAEAKKQETKKPLKQRYADVISAWDQYVKPMGEMIDVNGAFDSIIDSSIGRTEQAIIQLSSTSGALISEEENVQHARKLLFNMREDILINFQRAREILKPLYEIARLNSKVTRGVSIFLDSIQKNRFNEIEDVANLDLYRKPRISYVSKKSALMKYYYGYREIKNLPPPTIPTSASVSKDKKKQLPPFDMKRVLKKLNKDIPINDVVKWAIDSFPNIATNHVLDIINLTYSEKTMSTNMQEQNTYKTATHSITGSRIEVEIKNG